MKKILIISHPRSGCSLVIDSLVNNLKKCVFPSIRPSFSTIENLYLPHDNDITDEFYDYCFNNNTDNELLLFKTHIIPEEFIIGIQNTNYFHSIKDWEIIDNIFRTSIKIYVYRKPVNVLGSWFNFSKNGGALTNAHKSRLGEIKLSEFIRSPNYYIMPQRAYMDFDRNTVLYLKHHRESWLKHEGIIAISSDDLLENFQSDFQSMINKARIGHYLKNEKEIIIPPINIPPIKKNNNRLLNKIKCYISLSTNSNFESANVRANRGIDGSYTDFFSMDDLEFIKKNLAD